MNKIFLIITIIFSILVVASGALIFTSTNSVPKVTAISYKSADKDRPKAEVGDTFSILGNMKVSDQKTKEFRLKNTGNKPLQLLQITSSCNCTSAQVVLDGKASNEFGMHAVSENIFEVLPQKEAIIRVIYRPYIMPVYGQIDREVYITTNDPDNQKISYKVRAYVK